MDSQFGDLEAEILRRSMMPSERPSTSPDGRPSKAVNLEMEILRRSMMPSEKQSLNSGEVHSAPSRSSQMSATRSSKMASSGSSKIDQKMQDFKDRKSVAGQD